MRSKARANNYSRISLISRDGKADDYAASFQSYYAYMAREMDMEVEETYFYENKAELEAAEGNVYRNTLEEFLKP